MSKLHWDKTRKVGEEVSKWYIEAIDSGFMDKYLSGEKMLDIGGKGYLNNTTTFHDNAICIDKDTPNYDLITLPFENNTIDAILASHVLEHIPTPNVLKVIRDWFRVLKIDSYMVISVPHQMLYEKKYENNLGEIPGSHWNSDHQRFYTPAKLLAEIESALEPNSYRVELLKDNDKGYSYNIGPENHCTGQCEIMLVLKKIKKPDWDLMKGLSENHRQNKIICGGTGQAIIFSV